MACENLVGASSGISGIPLKIPSFILQINFFSFILLDGFWIPETSIVLTIIIGIFLVVTIPVVFGKYNSCKKYR